MSETEHATETITSIGYVGIFLAVLLLSAVLVIGAVGTAENQVNGNVTIGGSANNEAGFLNNTGYSLSAQSTHSSGFTPTIVAIVNATDSKLIGAGNYTLTGYTLKNKTAVNWNTVKINYTYTYSSTASSTNTGITNIKTSVVSMVTNFFELAPTIGTILAVVILIAGIVILVLYVRRMKGSESNDFSG